MKRSLIFVLSLFLTAICFGQTLTQVKALTEDLDGRLCLLSVKKVTSKYSLVQLDNSSNNNQYRMSAANSTIDDILSAGVLFRIVKQGDCYYLLETNRAAFFAPVSGSKVTFDLLSEPTESAEVTMKMDASNAPWLQINNRILINESSQLKTTTVNSWNKGKGLTAVLLYTIDEIPVYMTTLRDTEAVDASLDGSDGVMSMFRSFLPNEVNTLVLPFDVSDYRYVFGRAATAYEIIGSDDETYFFTAVGAPYALKSNHPYLLIGADFYQQPYIFPTETKVKMAPTTYESFGLMFHAVYAPTVIDHQPIYAFGTNSSGVAGFYSGANREIALNSFRWYVSSDDNKVAQRRVQIGDMTAIAHPVPSVSAANDLVYTLQGQLVGRKGEMEAALPHGVYIVNGKKYMK